MSVCAAVDGVIHLASSEVHPKALERLWNGLTFANPNFIKAVRFGRAPAGMPEKITLIEPGPDTTLLLPRGAVGLVRDAFAAANQVVEFEDRRCVLEPVNLEFRWALRDYQDEAAAALVRNVQGCVVAPCGSGKSRLALGAIARLRQPALVLVHNRDLLEQWVDAIGEAFGLKAGVIAEGRVAPGLLTVAMVQTLAAMDEPSIAELAGRFGCVVLDECHSAAALTFRRTLARFPAKFRFGLSATPDREDGLGALLELCIGPIVYRIEHQRLVDAGHLIVPQIEPVQTGCEPYVETHSELITALTEDEGRNRQLVDLVAREAAEGRTVLVLSGRVEHCDRLAGMLRARDIGAETLTSEVSRKRRADVLGRFRAGTLSVVCATSLADEGLDVPRLDRLVLATPARAEGRTVQRLGRLMRPSPGKGTPVLYDFVDEGRMAAAQFRARCAAYRKVLGGVLVAGVGASQRAEAGRAHLSDGGR